MVTTKIGGKLIVNGKVYTETEYQVRANFVDLNLSKYQLSSQVEKEVRENVLDASALKEVQTVSEMIFNCKKISETGWVKSKNYRYPQLEIKTDGKDIGLITFEVMIEGELFTPNDVVKHIDISTKGLALHVRKN